MATHRTPPWRKPKPKGTENKVKLTPESVAWAKARAKRAKRRHPNLVDNMAATQRQIAAERSAKTGAAEKKSRP